MSVTRPPAADQDAVRKLVDAGLTPGKAAKQLGIGRSTAYRIVQDMPRGESN